MKKEEVKNKAVKIFEKLLDELFPDNLSCLCCGEELNSDDCLCENCLKGLIKINNACNKCGDKVNSFSEICLKCKETKRNFERSVSCFEYDKTAKSLIYKLKYGAEKYVAKVFGKFLYETFKIANFSKIDIVCCAPLNEKRLKTRGYNQAQVLLEVFTEEAFKNCEEFASEPQLLKRVKNTQTQTHLTREERKENLKGAFELNCEKDKIKGKNILVIDDIFTTGATIEEMTRVLKKAGANKVFGLTVCHTVLEKI